jgi:nitrogen fixation/metabolism regulation signal transduction histidine kinase
MAYQRFLRAADASHSRATASDDTNDEAVNIQQLKEGFHNVLKNADAINADDEEAEAKDLKEAPPAARDKQSKYIRL